MIINGAFSHGKNDILLLAKEILEGRTTMNIRTSLTRLSLAGIILMIFLGSNLMAASVVGTYEVTAKSKFTVNGFFTDNDVGKIIFKLFKNKKFRVDGGEGNIFRGKYKLLNKGTKIQFNFSKDGKNAFKKMLALWAKDEASSGGSKLKKVKVAFSSFTVTKAKVTKKGKPYKCTIKIVGNISGILDGAPMGAPFTYVVNVKFDKKL
jgi:hypothetical protein